MMDRPHQRTDPIHCRIGSLEILSRISGMFQAIHCRIGSLEIGDAQHATGIDIHCRIGSLEILAGIESTDF